MIMVNNMEEKETLRQYLTYNKDENEIDKIFMDLDRQLKHLHKKGYYVSELNSDTILLEKNKVDTSSDHSLFSFASIAKSRNKEVDFSDNITDLSKLAIGAFLSFGNGFSDYSQLDTNYLKKYFNEIAVYIPNNEYFANVILNDDTSSYYSDYVNNQIGSNSKGKAVQKMKATEYGKMYTRDDEAAFVQIVFYPVIIISIITVIAVLSKILN